MLARVGTKTYGWTECEGLRRSSPDGTMTNKRPTW